MRLVIQKVKYAKVLIKNELHSKIKNGLIAYTGVSKQDTENDIKWAMDKLLGLRIFEDNNNKMNLSVKDVNGEIMIVSQFTLYGDARKGKRPSFTEAAPIEQGKKMYLNAVEYLKTKYKPEMIKTGVYQAMMNIEYVNEGPVTILIDSEKKF